MQVTLSQHNQNVHSIQYPLMPNEYHLNQEGKTMLTHIAIQQWKEVDEIVLPQFLYDKVHGDQPLRITFGNRTVCANIRKGNQFLEMSQTLASQLLFPLEEATVSCQYNETKNELKIGPIIALLVSQDQPFGSMAAFIQEMARYCKKSHVIFYVMPLHLQHAEQIDMFNGYLYINNRWVKKELPLPDVIHNRIASRKLEKSETTTHLFAFLQKQRIPIFNERFLNKWEVFNAFKEETVLIPHLPNTTLYRKASDLDTMLQKHPVIYVKPINGSLGQKIMRITQNNGKFTLQFSHAVNIQANEYTLLALLRTVIPIVKKEPYIIQQGIPSLMYHDRHTDFRVLCNKDKTGKWQVSSIVARCSPHGQIVSNLAKGGTLHRPEQILNLRYNKRETEACLKFCNELALHCAHTIERHFHGIYGELGIDLIVDENGKPWIIEANTKPSKTDETNMTETIRPSTKALIQFAKFLYDVPIV